MNTKPILAILLAVAVVAFVPACKRGDIDEPGPTGPSSLSIILKATASPNTLFAGDSRGVTTINCTLRKYDGSPLGNRTIFFEILDAPSPYANKINWGYFEGNTQVKVKSTDSGGNVSTVYYGPTSSELEYQLDPNEDGTFPDHEIYIKVTSALDGGTFVYDFAQLNIITDALDYQFELRAYPAVLVAGTDRDRSQIVATVKRGGKPVSGKRIWFEILSPMLGYFAENMGVQYQSVLDSMGQSRVSYLGPLSGELGSEDVQVIIQGRVEMDTRQPPPAPPAGPIQIKETVYLHVVKQL